MPKFTATITKETTIVEVAYITVDAESKEAASTSAETMDTLSWQVVSREEFRIIEEVVEE